MRIRPGAPSGSFDAKYAAGETEGVHLTVGSFTERTQLPSVDGDPGIRPQFHTFVGSRAVWDEITDDLPQYEGYKPAANAATESP